MSLTTSAEHEVSLALRVFPGQRQSALPVTLLIRRRNLR